LDAALAVFAEHGYRGGKVRDICDRAGANLAAVNYHFGDKASLYAKVIQHAYTTANTGEAMPNLATDPSAPRGQLAAWIGWYLRRLLHAEHTDVGRLMAREMADPSPALDQLAQRSIQPIFNELSRLVQAVSSSALDDRALKLHCISIIGQCLVYRSGSSMLERLDPPHFGSADADEIAAHIAGAAVRALASAPTDSGV
jgi:AcrR family transcriptional regulator